MTATAHRSDLKLLALHGLRLRPIASPAAVADIAGADPAEVEEQLTALTGEGLVVRREGRISGFALLPAGRQAHQQLINEELEATGTRDAIYDAYRRFLALNGDLLEICTAWQLKDPVAQILNDHDDPEYDRAVIERLGELHERVRPVLADLREALDRYRPYGERFEAALEKVLAGDTSFVADPMVPSYHTVWFELHEDLLATLGIDRASEGSLR
jgi:DNA-binding MarR family transcriptional regulator